MPDRVPPIARVPLARSLPRLLAWPAIVIFTGIATTITFLSTMSGAGLPAYLLAGFGVLLAVIGVIAAIVFLSVRLDVEEAAVRVHWLGGERVHSLARGPVTRVRLRGEGSSRLQPSIGSFGWGVGRARLRDEEGVVVVRLAPTETAILVPTEHGRLAIAARDEQQLLEALSRAARARQRLAELTETQAPPEPPAEPRAEPEGAPSPPPEAPHVMTGIERSMLERHLVEQRDIEAAAIAAAAEAKAQAQAEAVARAEAEAARADTPAPAMVEPRSDGRRWSRRVILQRPRPSAAVSLLPLVGAGVAWGVGMLGGRLPDPGTEVGRLTALALVLAGPVTTIGAVMARAWWPRIVGVVVAGGLAASVFIGRSLLGG
ncbi:MAG: hypothetical protein ACRDGD_00410 [Candidatus Limnocylindria bacterium]